MNSNYIDMYEQTSSRSPGAHRLQPPQIHRQGSRQFDGYGNLPPSYSQSNTYTPSESSQVSYLPEPNRFDGMGNGMGNGLSNGIHNGGFAYDGAQSWNPNAFSPANGVPFAATTRAKSNNRGRSQLPQSWMSAANQTPQMMAQNNYTTVGPSNLANPPLSSENMHHDGEDELIPTAIVIKNIPFAVKKEQLLDLMTRMRLPLPYAFNYHFDNGVFRGLAFANFTTHGETLEVIERLNQCDVAGRKLRVEFKKMLPLHERERIEREKRQRRGQLEEQHRAPTHHPSMSSMNSYMRHTPSPQPPKPTYDLNDPKTREFYNEIFLFKSDKSRDVLEFSTELNADERRIVHTIAHTLDLDHDSSGEQGFRKVRVSKPAYFDNISPSNNLDYNGAISGMRNNSNDTGHDNPLGSGFNQPPLMNPKPYDERLYNTTLRGQHSTSLLSVGAPDSPLGFGTRGDNLRAAKSHADLRTVPSPSPSPSLSQTGYGQSRFEQFFSQHSAAPLTSTVPSSTALREDNSFINGFGNMTIGATASAQSSPRNLRNMWSRDSDSFAAATNNNAGAVGSNRSISTTLDDSNQNGRGSNHPARQPRGPAGTTTFSRQAPRQNGHQQRSSDELRASSLIEGSTG